MRPPAVELALVTAAALVLTLTIAAPVLRAPSERLFGAEIVGRHHDPFTVMEQFSQPRPLGAYAQPVTDLSGRLLARVLGPVPAYNAVVLASFPLAAAAAYLLARHLRLSPVAAAFAGLAYAFAPFHLAHAAYHPHIAQTQWIPVYFLALWRCLDAPSVLAAGMLGAATLVVTFSNFYGGLIAAVVTPVALCSYWALISRPNHRTAALRSLAITMASLVVVATCVGAYAWYAANDAAANRMAISYPRADLGLYGATWLSYVVPPIAHPLMGQAAAHVWAKEGVGVGLLEQQLSLGWSVIVLDIIAIWGCVRDEPAGMRARVVVMVLVAASAFLWSLAPDRAGALTPLLPSGLLHHELPVFRAYARFGLVVQLMAVLMAGVAIERLRHARVSSIRWAGALLVVMVIGEYAVLPSAMGRDVLPTKAHRWVLERGPSVQALDCSPVTSESVSVEWLSNGRIHLLRGPALDDCDAPNLAQSLAAHGYTHLIARRGGNGSRWLRSQPVAEGLDVGIKLNDATVFTVTASVPAIYTESLAGFSSREHDAEWSWRWMGLDASWSVVNTRRQSVAATLSLELTSFDRPRWLMLRVDGRDVQTVWVGVSRQFYRSKPLILTPGVHEILFHPLDPPTVADDVLGNGDRRPLSFALGRWVWTDEPSTP